MTTDTPPTELDWGDDDADDEPVVEPYHEPNPDANIYPPDWTPHQWRNWQQYGEPVYSNLDTEAGRYWYRRTWRPKKRNPGMMQRDHVTMGEPEDYIAEHVREALEPDDANTKPLKRQLSIADEDTNDIKTAIDDIVRAHRDA